MLHGQQESFPTAATQTHIGQTKRVNSPLGEEGHQNASQQTTQSESCTFDKHLQHTRNTQPVKSHA